MKNESLYQNSWGSVLTIENCEAVAQEISRRIGNNLFVYIADRPLRSELFVQVDCHLTSLGMNIKTPFSITSWEYDDGVKYVGFTFAYSHGVFYHSTRATRGDPKSYTGQPIIEFDGSKIFIREPRPQSSKDLRIVIAIQEGVYVEE